MTRLLAPYIDRFNAVYKDRPFFVVLKAKLLAALALLILVFVPFNIAKNLWIIHPTIVIARIMLNLVVWVVSAVCLRSVLNGKLERAGNGLALSIVLAVHGTILVVGAAATPLQPLSVAIQTQGFDFAILLLAIIFASRRVAAAVFAVVLAGHVGYYLFLRQLVSQTTMDRVNSETLLREGLLALGFVFALGITLMQMIDAAHARSEEALRHSNILNENLERLEHETRVLSERRRELLEVQREFISMVSHEFRTPLTTIQGAQFLLDKLLRESATLSGSVAEETRKWLSLQTIGLQTLTKLVDQVLLLNRTEHMTGEAAFEQLSPGTVMADTVRRFNDSMPAPRVVLRDDLPPDYSASMDPRLVNAAAENLISNGLKYSALGRSVQVSVCPEPDGWVVEVVDEGRGIPLEDQACLFRPFFRAGNIGTVPGTGLGLVIVRRAVDFHGGRIEFESREDEGTRFRLHFPRVARPCLENPAPACIAPVGRD